MQGRSSRSYLVLVLLSTFLQGSSFVATKAVLQDVQPMWLATLRFALAAVSLLPVLIPRLLRPRGEGGPPLPWLRLAIIGLLQSTGVMAFLNIGLTSTTAPMAAILMASNPLLVALLAGLVLREPVRGQVWAGLAISFIGVVICIGAGTVIHGAVGRGELLVMLGSTCWALATLVTKRFNLHVDAWVLAFWQMLFGSMALALVALVRGDDFSLPASTTTWLYFLWLAIPASTGAMGLWFAALRIGGAVHTSGFLFLCPLFAAVMAFVLHGEVVSWNEIAGGLLIAIGIVLVTRQRALAALPATTGRASAGRVP
ncbi:DMT family transporter [Methylobacterium sp. CB376]|uniref:DMT family transporter n=1 Tax=unclassified Methylobacterium TaxID=2615210 RepID=UPI00223F644D|nr:MULTISPECIES: DMT family transporter [Methylobacterium]WFT83555.1 DMT family transporter [Methylobacterium nodulans]